MSELPRAPSERKYSWWWDSHISPKNSKWLHENLTDMDTKVKAMIKLIEEDADSFARRAEMYYKKRPELMNLVEEFYRAYRALAERYDNVTGVIRQAQRTMPEAFPNQDPLGISNDSSEITASEVGENKARKVIDFHDDVSELEVVSKFENEIRALKDALAQLEVEKEAGIVQYEKSLEKVGKLESEVYVAQEASRELNDRANRAEGEIQVLRNSLIKLEAEKEATLIEYHKCLNDVTKAESEKDMAFAQYKQALDTIFDLENKLKVAEEDARELTQQAVAAEKEVEALKQALAKLTEENEINAVQYRQCLEKISDLKNELSCAEKEVERLKGAEELCFALKKSNESLNTELGSLALKMGSQSEELTEKQEEIGKLWTCLQEERLKFIEAETAFQILQKMHSQTQEELRSLALELENKGEILKNSESQNESLLNEMLRIGEENKSLNECNLSSSMTIKEMQNDFLCLAESKMKLAEDVEQLQIENSNLKESFEKEKAEKLLLSKKLETMEKLIEKNAVLETSLSGLTAELEGARGKISALEQSFEALLEEKSAILAEKAAVMSRLQEMIENLEKMTEKNSCLENSLSAAGDELEGLKAKSKTLEKEKSYLVDVKDTLVSQGRTTHQTIEALGSRQGDLEERYSSLAKEREFTFSKLEELKFSLDAEKKEHATFAIKTETQLAGMGKQICLLQEEVFSRKREYEEEIEKAMNYQLEIFILKRFIEDLKEKNSSLLAECQKLVEGSKLSNKLISELNHDNLEKQMERESLDRELKIKNEELFFSQNEANKLLELNEELNLKLGLLTSLYPTMKKEINEVNLVRNNRENEINILSDANMELGVEFKKSQENFGLKIKQLESEGEKMFGELQFSNIFRFLLEDKFGEFKDLVTSKDAQIEMLENRVISLEGENGGLEGQLAAFAPLVMSLKDSISSLEGRTLRNKFQKSYSQGAKAQAVVPVSSKKRIADEKTVNVYSELRDLQFRVKVIERAVVHKERLVAKENVNANTKLEAAKKSIEGLRIRKCANREYSVPMYECNNGIAMKDIMLDKNSESSSNELSKQMSRSKRVESWDSTDLDWSIDLTIGRCKRVNSPSSEVMVQELKSKNPSSEIETEKELSVDKLEISRTLSQRSQDASKSKILERLNSDAQKLNDLQAIVQDMMKQAEKTEKGKSGNSLKEQLEEAEEAIVGLSDYNGKLMRSVEKRSFSSNVRAGVESEEIGSARRRRISDQARKVSVKIGKWQLQVQNIRSELVKPDDRNEKDLKGKSRVTEVRKRVMLRDYLYGKTRTPSQELRRKKSSFCGCVQPPTPRRE